MKTILITGASSGIGAETARLFANNNSELILIGTNKERLSALKEELGKNTTFFQCDFAIPKEIEALAQSIKDNFQKIDGIVNNAGVYQRAAISDSPADDWQRIFQINLFSHVELTRLLLFLLNKADSPFITNIASTLGARPIAETSAYSASKAAMINWSKTMAIELAPKIRVNCINPGLVETPIHEFYKTEDTELRSQLDSMQPMRKLGKPKNIAEAVLFLSDERSQWTTGSTLTVDGGIELV